MSRRGADAVPVRLSSRLFTDFPEQDLPQRVRSFRNVSAVIKSHAATPSVFTRYSGFFHKYIVTKRQVAEALVSLLVPIIFFSQDISYEESRS